MTARENVPVMSYFLQRGRCRHCGKRISIRYPLIEITMAALFAGAVLKFDDPLESFAYAAFFFSLVILTVIDIEFKLLPDRIVFPTFVVGWALLGAAGAVSGELGPLRSAALGAGIFGGLLLTVHLIYPAGMGFGDVKVAFVLGTFLGYAGGVGLVLTGMFLSFLVGSVVGVGWMIVAGGSRKMQIPFGPFLAAGTVLGIFAGSRLVDLYVGLL